MTKREIANLCCRVLAVYAILQALPNLPVLIGLIQPFLDEAPWSASEVVQQVAWATIPILLFVAAAFLWRWSSLIAAWMVGYDIQDHPSEPDSIRRVATPVDVHAIAFSVVGLWVLVDAVPRSLGYVAQFAYMQSMAMDMASSGRSAYQASASVDIVARVALGVWLLFGASGLVRLIHRLRNVGLEVERKADGQ